MADQLKGEVMIYELAQQVQQFLHEHNKPGYSSFYEEMVSRQQEKIQCEIQKKQLKEDKERQVRLLSRILINFLFREDKSKSFVN